MNPQRTSLASDYNAEDRRAFKEVLDRIKEPHPEDTSNRVILELSARFQEALKRNTTTLNQGEKDEEVPSEPFEYLEYYSAGAAIYNEVKTRLAQKGRIDFEEGIGRIEQIDKQQQGAWCQKIIDEIFGWTKEKEDILGQTIILRTFLFRDMGDKPSNTKVIFEKIFRLARKYSSTTPQEIFAKYKEIISQIHLEESELIHLVGRIEAAIEVVPKKLIDEGAGSQLAYTMLGFCLEALRFTLEEAPESKAPKYMFKALLAGFYLGLAYALVDNVIDENNSLPEEIDKTWAIDIVDRLLKGNPILRNEIPAKGKLGDKLYELLTGLHEDLPFEENPDFYKGLRILQASQLKDQEARSTSEQDDLDFYPDVVVKAGMCRIIPYQFTAGGIGSERINFFLLHGLLGQLRDDCMDFFEDLKSGTRTPYTHYYEHGHEGKLTNPFEVMFSVSEILAEANPDKESIEIIYSRVVYNLRVIAEKHGQERLIAFLDVFCRDTAMRNRLKKLILKRSPSANYEQNFRDRVNEWARESKKEKVLFEEFIMTHRPRIEAALAISAETQEYDLEKAAEYSLKAGGKRLRPLLTLMTAEAYGIDLEKVMPIAIAIESAHTASLIFDDLPAQDNAPLRRGAATLHIHTSESTAQLTGIGLIARSFELLAGLESDPEKIRNLVAYFAKSLGFSKLLRGQWMDLNTSETLDLARLEEMSYLKTGAGIEASLMPIILLAGANEDIAPVERFAYHLGIAFQIKDDILDVEGETETLGKQANIDAQNSSTSYVSLIGLTEAKKQLKHHIQEAKSALGCLSTKRTSLLEQIVEYVESREE